MNKPNPLPPTEYLIHKEIELKEAEARELLQWLQDNPNGRLEHRAEVQWRLNEALQAINDLVCKLKPGKIYVIR